MNRKQVIKKLFSGSDSLKAVEEAVRQAEKKTTGEIAAAVIPESADYASRELFAAFIGGVLMYAVLIPFTGRIAEILTNIFWGVPLWCVSAIIGAASWGFAALIYLCANIPAFDRFLVPAEVRHRAVYNRALRHFAQSGVYATKEHTGILIFISVLEREAVILADKGINEKVKQEQWDAIAAELASGLGRRGLHAEDVIAQAVRSCGELLSSHFPAHEENPDELPDAVLILESGV